MNKVILMGRLTKDVECRYSQGSKPLAIARYTLAVDRKFKQEGQATADFINCIAFGKLGEHAEKYYKQGTKIVISGRIQTGSYNKQDGTKVYTTDVVVEEQEFAESKGNSQTNNATQNANAGKSPFGPVDNDGFLTAPDNIDEEVPFFN